MWRLSGAAYLMVAWKGNEAPSCPSKRPSARGKNFIVCPKSGNRL